VRHERPIDVGKIWCVQDGADDGRAIPGGELRCQRPDGAEDPLHRHDLAGHRSVAEHSAMGGDTGYAQRGAGLVTDLIRK
jgi:hypothetical protein